MDDESGESTEEDDVTGVGRESELDRLNEVDGVKQGAGSRDISEGTISYLSVSYTHLTLPTIYSV